MHLPQIAAAPFMKEERAPSGSASPSALLGDGAGFAAIYETPRGAERGRVESAGVAARAPSPGRQASDEVPTDGSPRDPSEVRAAPTRRGLSAVEDVQHARREESGVEGREDGVPEDLAATGQPAQVQHVGSATPREARDTVLETVTQVSAPASEATAQMIVPAAVYSTAVPPEGTQGARPEGEVGNGKTPAAVTGPGTPGDRTAQAKADLAVAHGPSLLQPVPGAEDDIEAAATGAVRRAEVFSAGPAGATPVGLAGPGPGPQAASAVSSPEGAALARGSVVVLPPAAEGASDIASMSALVMEDAAARPEPAADVADQGVKGAPVNAPAALSGLGTGAVSAARVAPDVAADRAVAEPQASAFPDGADVASAGGKDIARPDTAVQGITQTPAIGAPSAGGDVSVAAGQASQNATVGSDGLSSADPLIADVSASETRLSQARTPVGPLTAFQSPDTPRQVAMQIAEVVRASGERAVELRLQPEELGRVQLTMSQDAAGALTVSLNVERAETLDLLRRNIDQLRADLQDLGYTSIDFAFQGDGAGNETASGDGGGDGSASASVDPAMALDAPGAPLAPDPARSGDGIDIRL